MADAVTRVVVVGAGLGGLAAACHLAGRGHEVTVVERGPGPGGRAARAEVGGYRFDVGPTVITMPDLLRDVFAAAGAEMDDFVRLAPLDPLYRATFADGTELRVRRGREAMTDEIRDVCGAAAADGFGRFCGWLAELYDVELPNFIDRNYDSPLDLARPLRPALRLARLGGFRRLASAVGSYFDDPRLQRLFSFQALYAGLAPHQALAVYAVITYMDTIEGVYFPEGGIAAIPNGMAKAAEKAGVTFRYDSPVDRIVLAEGSTGRVRGVRVGDELVEADAVVCNADLPVAYRTLLPGLATPRRVRRAEHSPSALVWHAGVGGELQTGTAHHNIHFGAAWESAFDALLRDGTCMPDPSTLVSVPTVTDASLAPAGRHVLYALEPVPNLGGTLDWTVERDHRRDALVARLGRLGYPVDDVDAELVWDPLDWEREGMELGTPFSISHRFLQSGPFRPANVERRAPGLVFVGSATVPGVGVPMVLLSGRLAADRVDEVVA